MIPNRLIPNENRNRNRNQSSARCLMGRGHPADLGRLALTETSIFRCWTAPRRESQSRSTMHGTRGH
eukprot:9228894-Pyramimonas_sp.AAC.1